MTELARQIDVRAYLIARALTIKGHNYTRQQKNLASHKRRREQLRAIRREAKR